jgi:divalent metal cation (Fe/Co/Zn/Cd) transporter
VRAIRDAIERGDHVLRVIHLRTEHLGPDQLLVGAKVEFERGLTLPELARAIDATEVRVRAAVPEECLIYIEPDLYDEARDPARPASS